MDWVGTLVSAFGVRGGSVMHGTESGHKADEIQLGHGDVDLRNAGVDVGRLELDSDTT